MSVCGRIEDLEYQISQNKGDVEKLKKDLKKMKKIQFNCLQDRKDSIL